jgi:serine/threonine protein kinase
MLSCPTCQRSVDASATVCPFDGTELGGPIGRLLGDRYRILSRLGSGAMGDVYLAEHELLRKKMAVKVLKKELCRSDDLVRRFQQEAIAASRIGQENIVSITDFGRTDDGSLYFVMEALNNGHNLNSLLSAAQPMPVERSVPILIQLSRALGAAHAQGIVHRDLKADNVMVVPRDDGSDLVKVLDFGISKMSGNQDANASRATQVGTVIGTPAYMAPEQARGDAIDHRADIYSFGVLAYELSTGTVPFEASTITGVLMKHISEPPQPPSARQPGVAIPAKLESLILRALEKDPARRPQSMEAVREELIAIAQTLGVGPRFTPSPIPLTPMPMAVGVRPTKEHAPLPAEAISPHDDGMGKTWISSAKLDLTAAAPAQAPVAGPAVPVAAAPLAAAKPAPAAAQKSSFGTVLLWLVLVAVFTGLLVERDQVLRVLPPSMAEPLAKGLASLFPIPPPAPRPTPAPIAVAKPPVTPPVTPPVVTTPVATPPATTPTESAKLTTPTDKPPATENPANTKDPAEAVPAVVKPRRHLSGDDVARAFHRSGSKIRHCLQEYRSLLPGSEGKIMLSFTVAGPGEVSDAHFTTPGLSGSPIEECVVTAVKEMKFPMHTGADDTFDLPFEYGVKQ